MLVSALKRGGDGDQLRVSNGGALGFNPPFS